MTQISLLFLRLKKLKIILVHPTMRRAFFKHLMMAGVEHKAVLNPSLSTIVDIGANRGQFALAARSIAGAKVISFEPLPGPAKVFQYVLGSDKDVLFYNVAIGPRSEQREMHVSAQDDSSSLLPISDVQSTLFPGTEELSTIEVQVAPLDTFIEHDEIKSPAMLKLDVQGYEFEALRGCESLLCNFEFIYCECSFVELYAGQKLVADVIGWLSVRNYHLKGVFNLSHDDQGQAIQADFYFQRSTDSLTK
jgi:FkbM family methyltransferase